MTEACTEPAGPRTNLGQETGPRGRASDLCALKRLYAGLGYVTAFVHWRCFHCPYEVVERYVPEDGVIMDLGCGYGLFANYLGLRSGRRTVLGIEQSVRKLRYADRGIANVTFRAGDITRDDWPPASAIVLNHVLHHLPSYEAQQPLLAACRQRLAPGGSLIILEIAPRPRVKFWTTVLVDHVAYPGDRFFYRTPAEFQNLLRGAGFRDIDVLPVDQGRPLSHVLYVARG